MRIAIVGYRGFVGRAVTNSVDASPHEPKCVDLARIVAAPSADVVAAVASWRSVNGPEWDRLVGDLRGVSSVINAAGAAAPDADDETMLWSANALLPAIVATAAAEAGVRRFVHVSSAAVQGDRAVLDETMDLSPQSPYARSKADGELAVLNDRVTAPSERVIYRPTSVMGADRPTSQRLLALFARRLVPAGPAGTPLPLALIGNIASAALFLATVPDPPLIALHPDEGMTVGALAGIAGGTLIPVPTVLSSTVIAGVKRAERARPSLAGPRRRLELLVGGQRIEATVLAAAGWLAPQGTDGYRQLAGKRGRADGPIRLAYLITRSDTIAGAQIHVRDLACAMRDAGHSVRVFVGGNGPYAVQLRDQGLDVRPLPTLERELGSSDVRALVDIRRALKDFGPDLVSCHSSKSGILGRIAGRSLGIPTLFTAHGWSFADGIPDRRRTLFTVLERLMAPLTTKLITVAHKDQKLAEVNKVGKPSQIVTIHNAVHDIDPALIADPGRMPPTIVSIARFDEQKDHVLLFRALARLDSPPRLRLIGDGPREGELRSLAADLGLANQIEFLGLRHDVPELLASAQLYVLASNWEGLPRSIIEALRAGLPVVASDVGGVSELVEDGVNGRLLPHSDLDALTTALRDLIRDAELRSTMGAESRARYVDHFTFDRVLAETRAVYTDVLGVGL